MSDIVCISPIDGKELVRRPAASAGEIDAALAAARKAQKEWRRLSIEERSAYVLKFLDAMLAMNQEVVPELAQQMGRPVRYGGEFRGFEERVRYMARIAKDSLAPTIPDDDRPGFKRMIKREPLGLVFVVAPWNYPFMTAVNTVAPALIAGNAVILKHAAQTILVGERFQKAMDAAGLPKGVFQNLVLTHEQTSDILAKGLVDHTNFTGSVAGGRAIEKAAAGTFMTLGLELGGKDPAYVRADANVEHAIENLVDGAFFNSGQSCCGIQRIYVARPQYEEFVERAVALTNTYVLGNPLHADTTLGPVVRARAAADIREVIAEAVAAGAQNLIDPSHFQNASKSSPYVAPALLTRVNHRMRVMNDECFGPVVGIMPVDTDDEAVALMNDSPYGLTAAVFTQDEDAALALGRQVRTGTFFMNRCDYLDPALAWTGVKNTGRGVSLSVVGYEQLTQAKSFHLRSV